MGGKASLLGVFGSNKSLPEFPALIQKLCIVFMADVRDTPSFPIVVTMQSPEGIALPPRMEHTIADNDNPDWNFRVIAALNGLSIPGPSTIAVEFVAGSEVISRTLRFELGSPAVSQSEIVDRGQMVPGGAFGPGEAD